MCLCVSKKSHTGISKHLRLCFSIRFIHLKIARKIFSNNIKFKINDIADLDLSKSGMFKSVGNDCD